MNLDICLPKVATVEKMGGQAKMRINQFMVGVIGQ
jgi:hypothetical protein